MALPREAGVYVSEVNEARRRRSRFVAMSAAAFICGLFVIGAAWAVLYSPLFAVRRIDVSVSGVTRADAVRTYMDTRVLAASAANSILGFQNMLAWPEGQFDSFAPELPRVRRIVIDKHYLSRAIDVRVEERVPYGIWCDTEARCFWFDREGVLLDAAPQASGNLVAVVHDHSGAYLRSQIKVHRKEAIDAIISIFEVLSVTDVSVREVRLVDRSLDEVHVTLVNGPKLYFSVRFPADEAASVIASLQKNSGGSGSANPAFANLQYVDFRVAHRAYYK